MGAEICVVGMACVYAGCADLNQFWETVLTRRRGFRPFPQSRLNANDYVSGDRHDRDKTYVKRAAVIEDWGFDWKHHRIPKSTFEATDPTHWLALDTTYQALNDAGVDLDRIGRERAGVILGNSLTGELTRANLLRLRWPYVRRSVADGAKRAGLSDAKLAELLGEVEQGFKAPFPEPNEDTLAGALANVIAGRICNRLNLGGGGYTVDGACASSLLAVSSACEALDSGRLDLAIAGGVDISLDPLELVGFARTGALADGPMRVYDRRPTGFLPGEGCGILVLMRADDVSRFGLKPWAQVAGWGISSDGAGGITAPKGSAQARAMRNCYEHADFEPGELDFIEGHGTGTPVGDEQELGGFLAITAGQTAPDSLRRTGVTSVKTLLGHTKAAAGAAGLIKAVLGVNQRVLIPMASLRDPAPAFATEGARIYPISKGACLPRESTLRAGVSGAGFGGINCHIAISSGGMAPRRLETDSAGRLLASAQSAELFVVSAATRPALASRLDELRERSEGMSDGELVDLAAECALNDRGERLRAAIVAENVEELRARLDALLKLPDTSDDLPSAPPGCLLGEAKQQPRIGLLVPGQGAQFVGMGLALAERCGWAATRRARWDDRFAGLGPRGLSGFIDRPVERAAGPEQLRTWDEALRNTAIAQPASVMTSLQWLQWLRQVGVDYRCVVGHSLGEIPAMVAARLLSESEAMDIVELRARESAATDIPDGGMLALCCNVEAARRLLDARPGAVIANDNGPEQVVVAGRARTLQQLAEAAQARGIQATPIKVSKAFHTEDLAPVENALRGLASRCGEAREAAVPFYSSLHGGAAPTELDPFAYCATQITAPVRFREAVEAMAEGCDLLVELGPGGVLSGLARRILGDAVGVCALEPDSEAFGARFCASIGQIFVAGASIHWEAFYRDRHWRPFVPAARRSFIENPCCLEPPPELPSDARPLAEPEATLAPRVSDVEGRSIEDLLRDLIARETGFDLDMISADARMGVDLNLDSIKIAEVRAELKARGIELDEQLALATLPIREIAAAARRRDDEYASRGADRSVDQAPMPSDLPVLGYRRFWKDTRQGSDAAAVSAAVILHADQVADQAQSLAAALDAIGVHTRLLDAHSARLRIADYERLIALPAPISDAVGAGEFFARLGTLAASRAISSLALIRLPGAAPVFGFAQSLSLELPRLAILAAEAKDTQSIAGLAAGPIHPGVRLARRTDAAIREPLLRPWRPAAKPCIPVRASEVVIVSGGGKGITAECALALGRATGARMLLLGSSPDDHPGEEIERTLTRFTAAGLDARYQRCDLARRGDPSEALLRAADWLGESRLTGLIHGAGVNRPAPAERLVAQDLDLEYRIKVAGLRQLLGCVDLEDLKLCVGLGSVIGLLGLQGNCGYALANEALARLLADLRQRYPNMLVACPAFSVWSEVGMGAKLRVLESLQRQRIAPIPVTAGVEWFLHACGQPDAPLPLMVAAPMHGLRTWRQARGSELIPESAYLDELIAHEPGELLVSRPRLNPARDAWLVDHAFRGTLLFATVQALSAMGAGARALAGEGRVSEFEGLEIHRPIIAARQGDTRIELDVRRTPRGCWDARLGAPAHAHDEPAFQAVCRLGIPATGKAFAGANQRAAWKSVPVEVGATLYQGILFQGPLFRRIQSVLQLDLSEEPNRRGRFLVRREAVAAQQPVPDPFFLDALLQTLQVLVPRDQCLPVGIGRITLYASASEAAETLVEAEILERTGDGYRARVLAWNRQDGLPVAVFEDYRVMIVEHQSERPDATEFFEPLTRDRELLAAWLRTQNADPTWSLVLGAVDESEPPRRREAAAAQVTEQLGSDRSILRWDRQGKPRLENRPLEGVSISHGAGRLLSLCAAGRVGCDLQAVGPSTRDWETLLVARRHELWHQLTAKLNDRERAGTLVWAIQEALVKAGAAEADVHLEATADGGPRFRIEGGALIAGCLELVLTGATAIALLRLDPVGAPARITHYCRDLEMTFKDALPPLKSPTAPIFFAWMGSLREEAMAEIRVPLAHAFGGQGKGMVTNGTRLAIHAPVPFTSSLRAWVWLERVLPSHPSSFELGFQWAETNARGAPTRILARGLQRLTWVDIDQSGHVQVEPFPEFFAEFISKRLPGEADRYMPPLGLMEWDQAEKPGAWRRTDGDPENFGRARAVLETDETHSNFVGNIYFSHGAALAERACRKALDAMGRTAGGFFATELRLDHLGEAMPGDRIEAIALLRCVSDTQCEFGLTLNNLSHAGSMIATGRAGYRLYALDHGDCAPQPLPLWLTRASTRDAE